MNTVKQQMSRRSLLTTTALGVPAMGLLGAANNYQDRKSVV